MPHDNNLAPLGGSVAYEVLTRYPLRRGSVHPLGNHGGFSGACLWRVESSAGTSCLRAWPGHVIASRLEELHRLMTVARGRGLPFVPIISTASHGRTWIEYAGRLWELTQWLPGRANFFEHPSCERLTSACVALAQLHRAWQANVTASRRETCPAIERRFEAVERWQHLLRSGWTPRLPMSDADPVHPVARRAWGVLPDWVERVRPNLASFPGSPWTLQPCLCDPWHDNLLFEGERLTGLVDYGAVKLDHVAVDLARLLGSLVEDDVDGWRNGLEAYRGVQPLSLHEEQLARVLDWTGTVIGVLQWLRWLYEEGRAFADRAKVAARLEMLVRRIERWEVGSS
jgi:Ser/Thr protein kinase RdoA (MazF antagonist)